LAQRIQVSQDIFVLGGVAHVDVQTVQMVTQLGQQVFVENWRLSHAELEISKSVELPFDGHIETFNFIVQLQ